MDATSLKEAVLSGVGGYLLRVAQRSDCVCSYSNLAVTFGETCAAEGKEVITAKTQEFLALVPIVRDHIIDGFSPKAREVFHREFDFFEKVTTISGALYPLPKEERRAGIKRGLEKIQLPGDDCYLPTAPSKLVRGIQVNSGIPLQSAAKVPIMITFDVFDRDGDPKDIKLQACIFKVGDDCRQDVLALQVISLLKDIFEGLTHFHKDISEVEEKQLVLYAQMASLVNIILQWSTLNIKEIAKNFSKLIPFGTGLYPFISIINHSCSPNSVLVFEGRMATVRAMQTIPKGSEPSMAGVKSWHQELSRNMIKLVKKRCLLPLRCFANLILLNSYNNSRKRLWANSYAAISPHHSMP
ncbi:hypothetical protein Lser_V15G13765 [Lactuca serriola]